MKKMLIGLLATFMALLTLASVAGFWGYHTVVRYGDTPLNIKRVQEVPLAHGTSVYQVAGELAHLGVISEPWKLKLLLRLRPELAQIRAGLYEMTPGDTLVQLLQKMAQGKEKRFSLTLIEGQSLAQWQAQLQGLPHLSVPAGVFDSVLAAEGDDSGLPEGKFFPDTYHYVADQTLDSLLAQSYRKMQLELAAAWAQRASDLPLKSPYELLILASIIEKETARDDERAWIAAVFSNRLKKGMRLQTDPTVIYGMGERFQGNISRKDLLEMTPYNTYRVAGLPPTPIAAPSRAALRAAANPAAVNYLYFVSRNDGSHVFSSTLAEHNRAVNQFQRRNK
ncbi:endolytic transglycosylase MltG [Shewanella salipaludis]|uniref:Endolytic murein transglycosylase n=1 Tax=Shewanella salipaludis TaxID=2723052 RepID=A0A972JJL6_9GAMM|nr:endolytic transglycosylase MltG [Shewanella salipaludis]NMH64209.1 endolytic transglycosylase MltG [Shewanella salipaludis]